MTDDEYQYWIAAEGAVIDGPVALRDAAARYAVGHYPKGAMIKEHGDIDWMPLTPATLRCPMRSEPVPDDVPASVPAAPVPAAPVPAPANPDRVGELTSSDIANFFGAILIAVGSVSIFAVLKMDVSAETPVTTGEVSFRVANFHAMHRQSLYLMTAIASLLSGILILTRRR